MFARIYIKRQGSCYNCFPKLSNTKWKMDAFVKMSQKLYYTTRQEKYL